MNRHPSYVRQVFSVLWTCPYCVVQAELKNLIDISSSAFEFAKELIRHNLVREPQQNVLFIFNLFVECGYQKFVPIKWTSDSNKLSLLSILSYIKTLLLSPGGVPEWGRGSAGASSSCWCDCWGQTQSGHLLPQTRWALSDQTSQSR